MQLHVQDMMCGGCAKSVAKALTNLDKDAKVQADPESRTVNVETSAPLAQVQKALEAAGFPATVR